MYIRTLFGNFNILLNRWRTNRIFSVKWSFKKVRILKPLHINYSKYITIGKDTTIDEGARLDCYPIDGLNVPNLNIGSNTMIGFNFTALCSSNLIIGDNVLIASNVFISTENHGIENVGTKYLQQPLTTNDVFIDDNSWLGEKVTILPGVRVGKRSIIGANSVVTKSIPDYCIACGNPAKVIKKYDFDKQKWINV